MQNARRSPHPRFQPLDSRNRRRGTACGASGPLRRPRKGHKSPEISEAKDVHARASERFRPLQAEFVRLRSISDAAKAEHEAARDDFKAAQAACRQVQAEFDAAKAEHERHQDEFREAKQEAERTKDAFTRSLNELRAEQLQRKDDKRALAQQAGVPSQYWDDVWVSTDEDGNVNIYFGGIGEPAGDGHGHYAMDASGCVTYRRDPFDLHGAHNFTDYEERVAAPPRALKSNWYTKYRTDDETIHLMVDKEGNPTTDYPHVHIIHDEKNDEIRVVASYNLHGHSDTMTLSGDASGNDVNAAVEEMRRRL